MANQAAKFLRIDGGKLKTLRVSQFKTQEQVGEAIGIGGQNIARIEQKGVGQIYRKRVPELAAFFGMGAVELINAIGAEEGATPPPNGRIADMADPIPTALLARMEAVARARGKSPVQWLERVVQLAEERIAAQQIPMEPPTYHKGEHTTEMPQVPSLRPRRKEAPRGAEGSAAPSKPPRGRTGS